MKKHFPTGWYQPATARARMPTGTRGVCCASGVCELCPVDAKFTVQNGLAHMALNGNGALDRSIRHGEERVVSSYLLSSDFFVNGADEKRSVHYLGLYDPLRACSNPFARISDS